MSTAAPVTTLVADKLYAVHLPYELNGFVSTHPTEARGYAAINCYLLVEDSRALLIDTGFSVHEQALLSQLADLLQEDTTLSLFPAIGEFAGICNARPIIENFNVETVFGVIGSPAAWTDFRPEYVPYGTPVGQGALAGVGAGYVRSTDTVEWNSSGRVLEALRPPVRQLPSHWCYDAPTKTLFTGDSFNHVWRADASGPWVIEPGEEPPAFEHVYDLIVGTRFWWLPGANTEELLTDLRQLFEEHEVAIIAPALVA